MTRLRCPLRFGPAFRALACAAALALAGCVTGGGRGSAPASAPAPAATPAATPGAPAVTGEVLGGAQGGVRVALLLPKSAAGNGAATARAFRNAAELAMRDFPDAGVQLVAYDTKGDPAGAAAATTTALAEGAQMILGPVFSGEVAAAAPAARQAGAPIVAFSSDASVAGPGVYLLSFLPSDDINRIVSYSARQGRKSFAALLPANAYGSVAEAAFRRAVADAGGRIIALDTYSPSGEDIAAKAASIAAAARETDALLLPGGGDAVPALAKALEAAGVTRDKVKLLGGGQWDDPAILNDPALVGSWFAAPTRQGFDDFARRYQAAYGAAPPRNATLAYDAAVLASGLVRHYGANRFDNSVLSGKNGFTGVDGVFRFTPGGLTERRLAIYEITGSGARIVDPAARSFGGGV